MTQVFHFIILKLFLPKEIQEKGDFASNYSYLDTKKNPNIGLKKNAIFSPKNGKNRRI
jgi:hypothetical protein